jgi:hypothetical protein
MRFLLTRSLGIAATICACASLGAAAESARTVHVFVALCDNQSQGIVPVPAALGNGDDPKRNLYWGAAYGIRTYFEKHPDWTLIASIQRPREAVLERCVFKHRSGDAFLIADAYRGQKIRRATMSFLKAAAGRTTETLSLTVDAKIRTIKLGGSADLVAYIGHNGLMDFQLANYPKKKGDDSRGAIVLACFSKSYFTEPLKNAGAEPLLWTTGLMAPEAYTLSSAVEGWIAKRSPQEIAERAARGYNKYQRCGAGAARRLLVTGW